MNAAEMWERFCEKSGIKADYDDWAFGGAPDALAELVLKICNGIPKYISPVSVVFHCLLDHGNL